MATLNVQVWGQPKCPDTRKAERFFKERGVKFQPIDLTHKGPSAGELQSIASRVGGLAALVDKEGARYLAKGLKYADPSGERLERLLLDDPLLLRTPLVRNGKEATLGYCPEVWSAWIAQAKGA
jgi:arsenate reductase-like glutaredoxin family protein